VNISASITSLEELHSRLKSLMPDVGRVCIGIDGMLGAGKEAFFTTECLICAERRHLRMVQQGNEHKEENVTEGTSSEQEDLVDREMPLPDSCTAASRAALSGL
jgi:hypothetical protein